MISYKFTCTHSIPEDYFREFNNIVRFAHNRWIEGKSGTEIERICKNMKNISLMDASLQRSAINKAKSLKLSQSVVFGSKILFNKLKFKKTLDKDLWDKKRSPSIYLWGSSCDAGGNRKASLDMHQNKIIFKPKRGISFDINLNNDKRICNLMILQELCEERKQCFSLEILRNEVIVTFDEKVLSNKSIVHKPIKNRILSFDMNPNYIGLVVMDNQTVRHKEIIDLKDLNKISNKNKKLHETVEINSRIMTLVRHYRVELVAFEHLNIEKRDHGKGKFYNKLVNNDWNRVKLIRNLIKKCNIAQIKYKELPAFYSSFVGCLTQPEEYDSIAAAMELGRRARQFLTNQSVTNFPEVDLGTIATRWKEMLGSDINVFSWKNLYDWFKKQPKLSYRRLFSIKNFDGFSFRLKSLTSGVVCHLV